MANLLSGTARLKDAPRFSIVKERGFARLVGSILAGVGAIAMASGIERSEMSTEALKAHVVKLAGEIGERNVFRPRALAAAETYIADEWQRQGFRVERQVYRAGGVESANLLVTVLGGERPKEIILLGAHYDSERGTPGADDNASGVAALIEISRWFKDRKPRRTIRFVAFVNEEMPFFLTGDMGSVVYAKAARDRGEDIRLMISLEMLGYYRDTPGSQSYPPLFRWFYPDRGNFVAFVSNFASRTAVRQAVQAFRVHSDFPVEYAATFASIPGVSWSDHASFWRRGYRAFMVTDTAFHRNPNYHLPYDTWDTLDYPRLALVAAGLARMTEALANADEL